MCYDFFRILRRVFPHCTIAVALEDLLYWMGTGFFVFARIYGTNQGILRNFLFLGIFLGAFFCRTVISPIFVKVCTGILGFPVAVVKKIIKRLLFWSGRCKILMTDSVHKGIRKKFTREMRAKRGRRFGRCKEKEQKKENRV